MEREPQARSEQFQRAQATLKAHPGGKGADANHGTQGGQPGSRLTRTRILGVCIAAAVAAVIGISMLGGGGGDPDVSPAQKQAWAAAFAATPAFKLDRVKAAEMNGAIASMALPSEQERKVRTDVETGRTRLAWLSVQDVMAEDGDSVRVDSGSYSTTVTAMNALKRIVVPEPPSGIVNVTGITDGGGGITIAITSGGVPVNLPYLTVGQVVGVPVVLAP